MPHSIQVLILSADQAKRRQWAEMLDAPNFQVFPAPTGEENASGTAPPDFVPPPDIVLADVPPCQHSAAAPWSEHWEQQLGRGEIGLIALAPNGSGDVVLPEDCTPRELRLACRLLAQIVGLRRQRRHEAHARQALQRLAQTDPLTGLANLRVWRKKWKQQLSAAGADQPLCLALFDLDGFKKVNELQGHRAGDALLKRLSQQLAQAVAPHDFVARLGGDEFGLLMPGIDSAEAFNAVERARRALAEPTSDAAPAISASAGFVVIAPDPSHIATNLEREGELFDQAEAALRCAKRQGANQTCNAPLQ